MTQPTKEPTYEEKIDKLTNDICDFVDLQVWNNKYIKINSRQRLVIKYIIRENLKAPTTLPAGE